MQAIKVKKLLLQVEQRNVMLFAADIQNELTGSRLRQRRVSHYVRHQQSDKQFIHLSESLNNSNINHATVKMKIQRYYIE